MSEGHTPWDRKLCPECGKGQVQVRRNGKTGELFYACRNPYCNETWNIKDLNEWEVPEG